MSWVRSWPDQKITEILARGPAQARPGTWHCRPGPGPVTKFQARHDAYIELYQLDYLKTRSHHRENSLLPNCKHLKQILHHDGSSNQIGNLYFQLREERGCIWKSTSSVNKFLLLFNLFLTEEVISNFQNKPIGDPFMDFAQIRSLTGNRLPNTEITLGRRWILKTG